MAGEQQPTPRLSEGLRLALKDCANFTTYWWKPKTMEKLSAIGLVERLPQEDRAGGQQLAYRITAAGKKALADGR